MIDIRFLTMIPYNLGQVLAAKESFEQSHPGVRIMVEQCKDYYEMMRAFHAEEAPDLIETGGFPLGNSDNVFMDHNPYVAETAGMEEDMFPGLLRVARTGGMLPGLPIEISPPLIVYDKEMFDQAGLAYPAEDWTWNDMMELAKPLTVRDDLGVASQFGLGLGIDIEWFEPFVMRNGGRYLAPDGSTARGYVDSPATIEAFRRLIDAFRVHRVIRKPGERVAAEDGKAKCAMSFCFIWDTFHLISDAKYGVVGLPAMPGGTKANMIYMGGAGVTTKSPNPRLSWAFLCHYLLDCHSWMPPVSRSQAQRRGLTDHPIWSRYLQELDHVHPSGYYLNKKWNASRQLINEDIHRMIVEGADVAQTLRSWIRYA